jgi:hypothetical protein
MFIIYIITYLTSSISIINLPQHIKINDFKIKIRSLSYNVQNSNHKIMLIKLNQFLNRSIFFDGNKTIYCVKAVLLPNYAGLLT